MNERALATPTGNMNPTGTPVAQPASAMPATAAIRCLLIEDSKYDRQRVRRIAEQTSLALDFLEAATLDEALTLLSDHDIDVILLDQGLPDGEGTVAAELLRNHLAERTPPIVMISGNQQLAMPARAIASGCIDFISKDELSIPRLEKAVNDSVGKRRSLEKVPTAQNAALQSFAEDTVLELRISMSRMLRLIARAGDKHPAALDELGELRTVCCEIWDYIDDLPRAAKLRR